jgi:hypothetical protein
MPFITIILQKNEKINNLEQKYKHSKLNSEIEEMNITKYAIQNHYSSKK